MDHGLKEVGFNPDPAVLTRSVLWLTEGTCLVLEHFRSCRHYMVLRASGWLRGQGMGGSCRG
jgi:hypothetical protein